MRDDDTMRIPSVPATYEREKKRREPGDFLLGAGVALLAVAATALVHWVADPKLTTAQEALIATVALTVAGVATLSSYWVRRWIFKAKTEMIDQLVVEARKARCRWLDVANTVSGFYGEAEAIKALLGDFIKRYPPVESAVPTVPAGGSIDDVVQLPSSEIYQLGITEGMRRARQDRESDS